METVIRVGAIYLFIIVTLRILGKREFSQLSSAEIVMLLLVSELVSQGALGEDFSVTNAFIAVTTLFSLLFLTSVVMHLFPPTTKVISGQPKVLVHHGQLINEHLNKERVTPEEIYTEMHKTGLTELRQVKWAILESDGKIAIVPEEWARAEHQKPPGGELIAS